MAKDFSYSLYHSRAWETLRTQYLKKVGGLCERCLQKGLYTPATIVHHKIYLTPDNVKDPQISLNADNLEALCLTCHNEEHIRRKRYTIDDDGNVVIRP